MSLLYQHRSRRHDLRVGVNARCRRESAARVGDTFSIKKELFAGDLFVINIFESIFITSHRRYYSRSAAHAPIERVDSAETLLPRKHTAALDIYTRIMQRIKMRRRFRLAKNHLRHLHATREPRFCQRERMTPICPVDVSPVAGPPISDCFDLSQKSSFPNFTVA